MPKTLLEASIETSGMDTAHPLLREALLAVLPAWYFHLDYLEHVRT